MESEATWRSDLAWAVMTASVVGYEVWTLRNNKLDWTLTRTIRRTFRTKHPYGKAVWAVSWGWFSVWLAKHILESDDPIDALLKALTGGGDDGSSQ